MAVSSLVDFISKVGLDSYTQLFSCQSLSQSPFWCFEGTKSHS